MKKGHNNFTTEDIRNVWNSVSSCKGQKYCRDPWGRKMCFFDYGKKTEFGWNIDHILPISSGGGNNIDNLQPLHWISNNQKGSKSYCSKGDRC